MGRKKKKVQCQKVIDRDIITELSGWKIGDVAWATTYPTDKTIYGEVIELHPFDSKGKAATILDETSGKYMTVLLKSLSEKQITRKRDT